MTEALELWPALSDLRLLLIGREIDDAVADEGTERFDDDLSELFEKNSSERLSLLLPFELLSLLLEEIDLSLANDEILGPTESETRSSLLRSESLEELSLELRELLESLLE
eukprot:CAMPEP_0171543002 /NCGR_PEP_ID=MMETSP0960-20121227/2680_1 /TAXON_ID=87120 /ORGANISM="Aurantiochytrium limacinum, Strain ATCCMYA-1381" /LENGTH=110 /DNA_ID=CAMNT_0012090605 /DNA_START=480 /DNA_END=812 /DNA_ORIENTATION=+